MKRERTLRHSEVLRLLHYDPLTGIFTWRIRRGHVPAGRKAGCLAKQWGYWHLRINDKSYVAHRVAWFYIHGKWPREIDHINGVKTDNRIANLRDASDRVNAQNLRAAMKKNLSGFLGVSTTSRGWYARITANGKFYHLGSFKSPEAAHAAYIKAKRQLHAGCSI